VAHPRQAARTLRAAAEAEWLSPEERQVEIAALLAQLPAYLERARLGLLAPATSWVELALLELDDLEQLASELAPPTASTGAPAGAPKKSARPPVRTEPWRSAIEGLRGWLLGILEGSGERAPTLDARRWSRLVQLASGKALEAGEIKALCLRDLARVELAEERGPAARARRPAAKRLALRARYASGRAFDIGREAQILRLQPPPNSVRFATEESPRASYELVSIRPGVAPGAASGSTGALRVLLQLPHRSWSANRTAARNRDMNRLGLTALGIRYGLAGEALLEHARRAEEDPLARLPVNRVLSSAIGLFAQDWVTRVDWVENPLRANELLCAELERQRRFEAARLLAALEIHAEGISLAEAAESFARRTGAGAETAATEALRAQRDPLHGLGYLGWLGLRALEQRMAELTTSRRALGLALLLVFRHPALRPADMAVAPGSAVEIDR
jgi:hypothetical protein